MDGQRVLAALARGTPIAARQKGSIKREDLGQALEVSITPGMVNGQGEADRAHSRGRRVAACKGCVSRWRG